MKYSCKKQNLKMKVKRLNCISWCYWTVYRGLDRTSCYLHQRYISDTSSHLWGCQSEEVSDRRCGKQHHIHHKEAWPLHHHHENMLDKCKGRPKKHLSHKVKVSKLSWLEPPYLSDHGSIPCPGKKLWIYRSFYNQVNMVHYIEMFKGE